MDNTKDEIKEIVCGGERHKQTIYSTCQLVINILVTEQENYIEYNMDYEDWFTVDLFNVCVGIIRQLGKDLPTLWGQQNQS